MARPISSSRRCLHARVQIARRQLAQARGQLLDGPADAVRQVDQQRQRHQPERAPPAECTCSLSRAAGRAPWLLPPARAHRAISRAQPVHGHSPRLAEYARLRRRAAPGNPARSPSWPACTKRSGSSLSANACTASGHARAIRGPVFLAAPARRPAPAASGRRAPAGRTRGRCAASDLENVSSSPVAEKSRLCSSSEVVIQTVAAAAPGWPPERSG